MIFKDYYKILALETNKVNLDEIKVAYREQAKKFHPDVNKGNTKAEERFKDINEAYKILSNSQSRKKYDRAWNTHVGKKKAKEANKTKKSASEDIFSMLFGSSNKEEKKINYKEKIKAKKIPIQGENVETEIKISIKDAFYGKGKDLSLRTVDGKMKTFSINIPEGIRNGEKIRLLGQGKEGKNGGRNGDLLIKVNIENDSRFKLFGSDIHEDIYISPWEAALGAKVEADTIEDKLAVYIPKGIQTGETIEIEEKGYKDGKGGRGKLILKTKIMVPKNITEQEKDLYKKLEQISKFEPRKIYRK